MDIDYDLVVVGAGPLIDAECHVLGTDSKIIPGLYAGGEAAAGVMGERYVGGGNSIGATLTMGRVAGKTISREVKRLA